MSAATTDRHSVLAAAWPPTGLWLLVIAVASLAVGLWPGAIYPNETGGAHTLPVLAYVAVGLAVWYTLVWPLVTASLGSKMSGASRLVQLIMSLVASAPLIVLAAFLSDSNAADVVRTVVAIVLLWPVAWQVGRWLGGRWGDLALLGVLLVLLGWPAAYYILREWCAPSPYGPAEWLWRLGPLTLIWEIADQRRGGWLPQPLWPTLLWPGLVVAGRLAFSAIRPRGQKSDSADQTLTPDAG